MPLPEPTALTAFALTLGAAASAAVTPAAAQLVFQGTPAPTMVTGHARHGPGLGSRQVLIPSSGVETQADVGRPRTRLRHDRSA